FFASDLQAGDQHRTHFFLKSHSRDNLPPFGKELCLYQSLDRPPLATWHLSTPVMDTDLHSAEVARILDSIIEKWAIGAVIVSSLIGHSLDVFRTGLPTALAVHDAYPFWPLLHDANTDEYSIGHLRQSLIDSKTMNIFAPQAAEYWVAIREELITLILKNRIVCIAPSVFAKERVCCIDSRLNEAEWTILPHGIAPAAIVDEQQTSKKTASLKVLVPGHINGGKGEFLLKELIPLLPDGIELVLLGSAHLSGQFASEKVTTIDHYLRDQLAVFVGSINPDVAMLASTVPETYGYVLSEMLQLGIPVIASNIGAYAERGRHLPGVNLIEPRVECFLETLIRFRDNPEFLIEQKKSLPTAFPDLPEMAASWEMRLSANPPRWLFEFTDDPNIENEVKMNLQLTHIAELLKAVYATTEKNTQSGNEALAMIGKQQSNIESMLEAMSVHNQQLMALLSRQNEFESALQDKDRNISALKLTADEQKNILQEQVAAAIERENKLKQESERNRSDFELAMASANEAASADKLARVAEVSQLQTRISALDLELKTMQTKRGWRFLSFFR
ncbi:MAG: hypothetical protein ACRERV_09455, partial [Methylococcales bacterium]